jgi:ABC-type Fe3+-siderophore transport system permease subunit
MKPQDKFRLNTQPCTNFISQNITFFLVLRILFKRGYKFEPSSSEIMAVALSIMKYINQIIIVFAGSTLLVRID